jgi:hypothetical protein
MISKLLSYLKLSLQKRKQPTSYPPSHISVCTFNPPESHSSLSSLAPIHGPVTRYRKGPTPATIRYKRHHMKLQTLLKCVFLYRPRWRLCSTVTVPSRSNLYAWTVRYSCSASDHFDCETKRWICDIANHSIVLDRRYRTRGLQFVSTGNPLQNLPNFPRLKILFFFLHINNTINFVLLCKRNAIPDRRCSILIVKNIIKINVQKRFSQYNRVHRNDVKTFWIEMNRKRYAILLFILHLFLSVLASCQLRKLIVMF